MTYEETLQFIDDAAAYGSVMNFDGINALLEKLKQPQKKLKFIHIAGTNGKGSCAKYISDIMTCAGYKSGRFSTPEVFCYEEKFTINGEFIPKDKLAYYYTVIKNACDRIVEEGANHPTLFEMECALSFLYFSNEQCDIVILEAGMGGRDDATNVICSKLLSVFTPIGLDHMAYLGDSIEQIALNKSGIIRNSNAVLTAMQDDKIIDILKKEAQKNRCILSISKFDPLFTSIKDDKILFSYKNISNITIESFALYQAQNAALAIDAALLLKEQGFNISNDDIILALKKSPSFGRFTPICKEYNIFIDGAHNIPAIIALKEAINHRFPNNRIIIVMGVLKDKAYKEMLNILKELTQDIICVDTKGVRGLSAKELYHYASQNFANAYCSKDYTDAVQYALRVSSKDSVIISLGSLSYLKNIYLEFMKFCKSGEYNGQN